MTGGRCHRQKMMGRGAEGGCGAKEKHCPVSRVSSLAVSCTAKSQPEGHASAVDLYSQARKALTEHSPFDSEEAISRVSTLPAGLAAALSRHSESRRKHKKLHAEPSAKPTGNSLAVANVWLDTEEYFREVTLADIDKLNPQLPFGSFLDSCLSIPIPQNGMAPVTAGVEEASSSAPVMAGVEEASSLAPVMAGVEEAEVDNEAVVEEEQPQPMEIDCGGAHSGDTDKEDNVPLEEWGDENNHSINWLLGSKHRAHLASERPSKKRKLLGGDAGLERLMLLPNLQGQDSCICDYCCRWDDATRSNQFLCCDSCKVSVHQKCYGLDEVPVGVWVCSWCRQLEVAGKPLMKEGDGPCLLCPKRGGALKPVAGDEFQGSLQFVHLFCSLWTPEVYVEDTEAMEPVKNVGLVHQMRRKLVCYLCKVKQGACIRCSHGTCRTSFHPLCAREAKHRMEIWGKIGCDNVELRAFCLKHSGLQDISFVQHSGNLTVIVGNDSSAANSLTSTTPENKLPKIRFSRKNIDKISVQDKKTDSCLDSIDKNEMTLENDVFVTNLRPDCDGVRLNRNMETADLPESGNAADNNPSDICNRVLLLKKLIDRGKVNVGDVASGIGISSDSLKAALVAEPTSLSAGLRSKILIWLQDSVLLAAPVRRVNIRSAKVGGSDGPSAAKVAVHCDPNADKVAGLDVADTVLVKSLPPRRRTKSNTRILKDNNIVCSEGDTFIQQNGSVKVVGDIIESPANGNESMENVMDNDSPSHNLDCRNDEQGLLEMISGDATVYPDLDHLPGNEGNLTNVENNNASDKHCHPELVIERMSSSGTCIDQAEGNISVQSTLIEAMGDCKGCDGGLVRTGVPGLNVNGLCSGSYIHPIIKRRLTHTQNSVILKQKIRDANFDAGREKDVSFKEAIISASNSCGYQTQHSSCAVKDRALDATSAEQLANAKNIGILELSPEDEVEGEIVQLQNRLLDNAVSVKHHSEVLIDNVVRNLPRELDALKKRRWDLVLANQFLRDVREAKKRGRKERRHKEAQAVLAAAAAAAAASSRMSSLRKDTNDEIIPAHQESPLKLDAACGMAVPYSSLLPRPRETKLGSARISSQKHSEMQWCDICRKAETILNPIFVCGSCKVAVHLDCYRRTKPPINSWFCELCEELRLHSRSSRNPSVGPHCGLCGTSAGAFRKSTDGQWIHAFCAEWVFESTFRRGQTNPVEGMDAISKVLLNCRICNQKVGACLKCSYEDCQIAFHPYCAKKAGLYLSVKNICGKLQHKAYCEKHSLEQREKADTQQHGAEELKTIKQIRVDLERVRLLCERIIKREKLKRELVRCSHEILASKRDHVAFTMSARTLFFPLGVSSESATTSLNTKSFSEAIQRSDDVTVDSAVSGKRKASHSLRINIDRKTGDSSTSQFRLTRKTADRMPFPGKQLPQRPASIALRNVTDGEKRAKSRKQPETFQKELLMTSDQATMQNQRLPKGFQYVPVDSLSKARNTEDCKPQEPNG